MDVEVGITLTCDCGHTREIYCGAETFEYKCGFCGKKWKINVCVEKG